MDGKKAIKWFRKAVAQGSSTAKYGLGGMYEKGQGVPQDIVEAYKWFILVAPIFGERAAHSRILRSWVLRPTFREPIESQRLSQATQQGKFRGRKMTKGGGGADRARGGRVDQRILGTLAG